MSSATKMTKLGLVTSADVRLKKRNAKQVEKCVFILDRMRIGDAW